MRFGGSDAEWVDELVFISWDLEKRWAGVQVLFLVMGSNWGVMTSGGVFAGGDLVLAHKPATRQIPPPSSSLFVFFRRSRHAFLEIKPEVMVESLERVIGMRSLHHTYALVIDDALQ